MPAKRLKLPAPATLIQRGGGRRLRGSLAQQLAVRILAGELKFLRDLFELRLLVEPGAAALAAQRRSKRQVELMRRALAVMARESLGTEAGRLADQHFPHEYARGDAK